MLLTSFWKTDTDTPETVGQLGFAVEKSAKSSALEEFPSQLRKSKPAR
jgi:hypothetical protein